MAISGIETLMQLGLLGKANFKDAKSLTTWDLLKTHQECFFVFLGESLEGNKVLSLLKVAQWHVFNRLMDAATQMLVCDQNSPQFGVEDLVVGLEECENSQTFTTTSTGSKNSQKEVNSQIDLQNSVLGPLKVSCIQVLGLG